MANRTGDLSAQTERIISTALMLLDNNQKIRDTYSTQRSLQQENSAGREKNPPKKPLNQADQLILSADRQGNNIKSPIANNAQNSTPKYADQQRYISQLEKSLQLQESKHIERETQILCQLENYEQYNQNLVQQIAQLKNELRQRIEENKLLHQQLISSTTATRALESQKQMYQDKLRQQYRANSQLQFQLATIVTQTMSGETQEEILRLLRISSEDCTPKTDEQIEKVMSMMEVGAGIVGSVSDFTDKIEMIGEMQEEIRSLKQLLDAKDKVIEQKEKERQRILELLGAHKQ